jgi:hypothetical protein
LNNPSYFYRSNVIFNRILYSTHVSISTVADADTLSCQGFAADRVIRDIISSGHATAEPCPCIEQILAIDETFEKINNCYKQWFFLDGVKQMCCYR